MESKENMSKNDFLIKNQENINIMKKYLSEIEEMGSIDPIRGASLLQLTIKLLEDKESFLDLALKTAKLKRIEE